jgi:hypothetical protein
METPPPYIPPKKKSNTGLIIGIVLGSVALCCILSAGVLFGGGLWLVNKAKGIGECAMSFQFAQKAMQAYAADHDGKLPNAKTWQDDIREYYKKATQKINKDQSGPIQFHPFASDGEWACVNENQPATGIAFNVELSGKKISDIKDPGTTVLLFETPTVGKNQAKKYEALDPKSSPKIFNENRGWIVMPVQGRSKMRGGSGSEDFDIDMEDEVSSGSSDSGK